MLNIGHKTTTLNSGQGTPLSLHHNLNFYANSNTLNYTSVSDSSYSGFIRTFLISPKLIKMLLKTSTEVGHGQIREMQEKLE